MAEFLDDLVVREVDDRIFKLVEPFKYKSDLVKEIIVCPAGFKTDFSSVPRLGVIYALLGDRAHQPAVVHDFLYYAGITTREMADDILLEAMGVMRLPWYQKYPIYWGVRLGGFIAWDAHRAARDGMESAPTKFPVPDVITPQTKES